MQLCCVSRCAGNSSIQNPRRHTGSVAGDCRAKQVQVVCLKSPLLIRGREELSMLVKCELDRDQLRIAESTPHQNKEGPVPSFLNLPGTPPHNNMLYEPHLTTTALFLGILSCPTSWHCPTHNAAAGVAGRHTPMHLVCNAQAKLTCHTRAQHHVRYFGKLSSAWQR